MFLQRDPILSENSCNYETFQCLVVSTTDYQQNVDDKISNLNNCLSYKLPFLD